MILGKQGKFKTFLGTLITLMILAGLVLAAPLAAMAGSAPVLTAGDVSGSAGDTVTVPVTLTSTGEVTAMQFDLSFDDELLTYVKTTRGAHINVLNDDQEQVYTLDKNLITDASGSRVRVAIYSSANTPLPGGSGVVANLEFTVAGNASAGAACALGLSNVTLSDAQGAALTPTLDDGQFSVEGAGAGVKEPGGDVDDAVFYIAVNDGSGPTKYYYYTREELEAQETQESYTYDDHSVNKTVTCKGVLVSDLLSNLQGVTITDEMIVQYAEQDAYHADANKAVNESVYKDTVRSLTEPTVSGDGSTKNPMRTIVTYLIHEEYENPDEFNVNDPPGFFKDADNHSGFLRAYRDTGGANSAVIKYLMGVAVSADGALLTGENGITVSCVSARNPGIKIVKDTEYLGLIPGMQYAVRAPEVTNATLAAGQDDPVIITVGSGTPADQVITFTYDEDTYFYVKNNATGAQTNYTYTDLVDKHTQVPDAATNTPPYGYLKPMYYRYNGVWLSDLLGDVNDDCTVKLVAKDGSKIDITDDVERYFVAYSNTESKSSTNIPEGKRVTITYDDAKIIIPSTGENITGRDSTDYTPEGKDVDVLMAEAEGVEIIPASGGGDVSGKYTLTPATDAAYKIGVTADGIKTMTVNNGFSGMTYFMVQVTPITAHDGDEAVVFVHLRNGAQRSLNVTKADFDVAVAAQAGFNVQPGDVVKAYIVDDLNNDVYFNPTILQ